MGQLADELCRGFATYFVGPVARYRCNQGFYAPIKSIECGFEHTLATVPWIANGASLVKARIKIAGNDDPRRIKPKSRQYSAGLIRMHYDDEVRLFDHDCGKSGRSESGQIEPSPRRNRQRRLGNAPAAGQESGGQDL